jgi:hypothetical protein
MMTSKIHDLKTWPESFEPVVEGKKRCEFRKDDRGFERGDLLLLREWSPQTKDYMGRVAVVRITHILAGGQFGVPDDYCLLSIDLLAF